MSTVESRPVSDPPRLLVVMGVAGCGKTSVGEALAERVGATFLDGDVYHPKSNIEKMSRGEPLTDEDRWPWLEIFGRAIASKNGTVIGGCSALKRVYRERITQATGEAVMFIYLNGCRELIAKRMAKREGHFMPTSLLDSQFETLEVPDADEQSISVDIDQPPDGIVDDIMAELFWLKA